MKLKSHLRLINSLIFSFLAVCSIHASAAADMKKTLHFTFEAAETGFDPAEVSDNYSNIIIANIFDPLLGYDHLARPAKPIPNTAESLPEIKENGRIYVFKLKKGIYFADDPAFNGKKRELTAEDYVYSLKRLVDPNKNAPWAFLLQGKVVGLDEKIEEAKKKKKFDFDSIVEGLKATDKYTLQITLKKPDYNLPYIMAMQNTGAVAREVVEKYGADLDSHPVGTGPYRLVEWQRAHRMVLEANSNYRGEVYKPTTEVDPRDRDIAKSFEGRSLPSVGRIDIRVVESGQASYLSFLNGQIDILIRLGAEYVSQAAPGGKLSPALEKKGVKFYSEAEPDTTYNLFNMDDPVVGGYTADKVALRRAIVLSYNNGKLVNVLMKRQGLIAQSPVPPGITGYDPAYKNPLGGFNLAKARGILDAYGYKDCDGDGWREAPGCKPLMITYLSSASAGSKRDTDELLKNGFDKIGVKLKIEMTPFPDLVKRRQSGKYQMAGAAWGADYPDAENYMQLLYGPNKGAGNESRFDFPVFNKLYEEIATMPQSDERQKKFITMNRLVAAYAPWGLNAHRIRTHLVQPWAKGFKYHPIEQPKFMYYDIDLEKRRAVLGE
ncbi:ABC transporter substrate-binding protein [Parachitinimonas caeni]|uniref:ABC transporter substrate-binding protein n=1 Tax=Parachitinimonas caeni TaxID=3031301 RepID=A0ABT7DWR9_9NEIS|nr:ABC transporter substrate-binding protein [Parachitinimonas caeni]MDK2124516.1 ABC transporter substrate-binding protein [Parachitinimonas caeni]